MSQENLKPDNPAGEGGYEHEDLRATGVVYFLLALGVATILAMFALRGVYEFLDHREKALQRPVNPLLTDVPADTLHSYGWVDEKAGTVRIPIERAMDLLVQRGLPVRSQGASGEDAAAASAK